MDKYNFTTRIYKACSNDELRPIMNCVHFSGGFALASNGYLAVRQSLEYHSIQQPENLEDKSIHRDNFKTIMEFEAASAQEDGVLCTNKDGRSAFFGYFDRKGEKIPNFDELFNKYSAKSIEFIGFNPDRMKILMDALYMPNGYIKVNFGGVDKAMRIEVPGVERQEAILMPVIIEATIF